MVKVGNLDQQGEGGAGPSGIPGSRDFRKFNPGIHHIKQNNDFAHFYWFLREKKTLSKNPRMKILG